MTETPEQRRERIEAAIWTEMIAGACKEPCWTHYRPIPKGCVCLVATANAILELGASNGDA